MEDKALKNFLKYLLIGFLVAIGGIFFSELCASIFNGLSYDTGVSLGMTMYLCIVVVVCTGLILSRMKGNDNKEDEDETA